MNILLTIVGIGIVILIHEMGHLLAAKWVGILAPEYSIGFGPTLLSKKWGETTYSLRAVPMGGFVRLAGMDDEAQDGDIPSNRNYYFKGFWQRCLVIVAGSGMNVILGAVIFVIVSAVLGTSVVTPEIEQVFPNSVASSIGMVAGDQLLQVDDVAAKDHVEAVVNYIHEHPNKPVQLRYLHQGQAVAVSIVPQLDTESGQGLIGIQLKSAQQPVGLLEALRQGIKETGHQIRSTVTSLHLLLTGKVKLNQMLGPVGIVQVVDFQMSRAAIYFLNLIGVISVNIGILNLFPFPALDGGHLLLLLIEKLRGQSLSKKIENVVNTAGMAALIGLMIFVLFNDVHQWGTRKKYFHKLEEKADETPALFKQPQGK